MAPGFWFIFASKQAIFNINPQIFMGSFSCKFQKWPAMHKMVIAGTIYVVASIPSLIIVCRVPSIVG